MRNLIAPVFIVFCLLLPASGQSQERIELGDGSELTVFLVRPSETTQSPAPLVILMGGGSGNASISRDTSIWLGGGFASRGWMVAVPVSPNNRAFRGSSNNDKVRQLADVLTARADIADGKVLLAGISNGGISALEIARRDPSRYLGVAAVPAVTSSVSDNEPLAGFPVYLRIGGEDELGWAERYEETVTTLESAGVELDAELFDGQRHMFRMDWYSLEPWLEKITASDQ